MFVGYAEFTGLVTPAALTFCPVVGLLHEPDILFLDEPTSGIDPMARRAFWRSITALAARGVTVIVTTHFMAEAEYCDRIVIQDAGKVLALGTPQEVRAQSGQDGGPPASMEQAFIGIVESPTSHCETRRKRPPETPINTGIWWAL